MFLKGVGRESHLEGTGQCELPMRAWLSAGVSVSGGSWSTRALLFPVGQASTLVSPLGLPGGPAVRQPGRQRQFVHSQRGGPGSAGRSGLCARSWWDQVWVQRPEGGSRKERRGPVSAREPLTVVLNRPSVPLETIGKLGVGGCRLQQDCKVWVLHEGSRAWKVTCPAKGGDPIRPGRISLQRPAVSPWRNTAFRQTEHLMQMICRVCAHGPRLARSHTPSSGDLSTPSPSSALKTQRLLTWRVRRVP